MKSANRCSRRSAAVAKTLVVCFFTSAFLTLATIRTHGGPLQIGQTDETRTGSVPAVEGAAERSERPAQTESAQRESDVTGTNESADRNDSAEAKRFESLFVRLPTQMPDGRRFNPIAFFQSQVAELIPANFRAVTIDRLNEAVANEENRATDDRSSRLRSSLYVVEVVDDTLISNRSVFDIESQRDAVVRLSLGTVNLAINHSQKPNTSSTLNIAPRIETDERGELSAVVKGDSAIHFGWSLRGESIGASRKFDLRIPRSPQTRIVLAAPDDIMIESLDGVLRDSPSPPPEIDDPSPGGNIRYYIIDAGGLQSVCLRTRPMAQASEAGALVVRRSSTRYEVDASGMVWTTRMTVQTPEGSRLPPIDVSHGTVTSVSVDAVITNFTTSLVDGSVHRIRIDAPVKSFQATPSPTTVSVTGHLLWDGEGGWCELPALLWRGNRVIFAEATSRVQLVVGDALQVVSWQLPETWGVLSEDVAVDAARTITAEGPPSAQSGNLGQWTDLPVTPKTEQDATFVPWSRVRLKTKAAFQSNRAALELNVGDRVLDARIRMDIKMDPTVVEPVRLQLQPGWSLSSISLPTSGRVIETPNVDVKSRSAMLWPEPSDVSGELLVIEATGVAGLLSDGPIVGVAPTWFLRPDGVTTDLVAAVVPPPGLNWGGETALVGDRLKPAQLTGTQQAFFRSISDKTLILHPQDGRTPLLSLQPPGITYGVTTTLHLRREGEDVVENLVIKTDSATPLPERLTIRTGPALGRPNVRWILRKGADAAPISLPPSDVRLDNEETDGQYTVDLSELTMRDRHLVGRRRYSLNEPLQFRLPTVPGATSQNSEVLLGPGLRLVQSSPSVLRVPADDETSTLPTADAVSTAERRMFAIDDAWPGGSAPGVVGARAVRLRYDAVDQPSITIKKSDINPDPTIVWQEQIRVIASSRGTDRVDATYQVSASEPIEIDYDPDLQLAAIYRDENPIDLLAISNRLPIVLQPAPNRETIRIIWNRNQIGSYWFRRCRIPKVTVSGVVVSSNYRLVSSADTFAPAALWRGSLDDSQRSSSLSMSAGKRVTLIRRNTALAVGWLLAAIVFAISWHVSRRSPLLVAVFVAAAVTTALLWWPWHIAIVGWVIVPTVAAGLLATSLAWHVTSSRIDAQSRTIAETSTSSLESDDSEGFSLATPLLLAALTSWAVACGASAQDIDSPPTPASVSAPVNVLVPVDRGGRPIGDKVYIPTSVHSDLFRVEASDLPQPARFLLADYRVKLQQTREDSGQSRPRVEAEYFIHVDRPTNRVLLPLAPTAVRRIELIQADRIVQFAPDSEGGVIVTLPKGDAFRLRLTLIPTFLDSPDATRLQLAIPPIASSRLSIETDRSIDAVKIGGAAGIMTEEPELGRRVVDLGPINRLDISYAPADRSAALAAKPLVRRYWVHIAKDGTTVECEVEPMTTLRRGGTVQLVVKDSTIPTVLSSSWRLQRSELVSASRRLITLENLTDSSTPIRLIWSSSSTAGRPDSTAEASVVIPDVIAPASGPNAAAWIAIDSDPTLRVSPIAADPLESLAVDQFLAAWKGYRGQIDRAFVAINELPTLEVTRLGSDSTVRQQHFAHVMPDELRLRYSATLSRSDATTKRHTLRYPVGVEVQHLLVNGQDVNDQPVQTDQFNEVALPSMGVGEPVNIELTAVASIPASGRFTLPGFQLWPRVATTDRFSLSRDRTSIVRTLKPVPVEPEPSLPVAGAETLAEGGIPIATWTLDATTDPGGSALSKGIFKVTPRQVGFASRQLIVLSWEQGRWGMETLVRFSGNRVPDLVDVQVPTRWCDSLEVTPSTAWSRQPAIDPSFQIIRIRCDAKALLDRPLAIRGRLVATDKGRVSVPPVTVLGRGSRKIEISVPDRLTNESIQWRFNSVRGIELPTLWQGDLASAESRSTYATGSPAWSIELAPLPQMESNPVVVSSDAQIFSKSDGSLVLCRWDLLPGGLSSVAIRLPRAAVCLGAWTAGRAVEVESLAESDPEASGIDVAPDTGNVVRLPLSLSRLAQPVEVLLRVPIASAKQADYMPELIDIPIVQQWVAGYEPSDTATAISLSQQIENEGITVQHPVPLQSERVIALASALADVVDYSLDTSVERPASEIATWLAPWVARYRQIAQSAGHQVNWDLSPAEDILGQGDAVASRVSGGSNNLSGQPWHALDARMSEHVRRFLTDPPEQGAALFDVAHFDGFVLTRVTQVSSHDRLPSVQPASASARDLQFMLVNLLTLGMVCGLFCLLWPLRRYANPIVVHPAFWLGLIGIFGFFVAPAPVAASLVLVSVSLPAFPKPKIRFKKNRLTS